MFYKWLEGCWRFPQLPFKYSYCFIHIYNIETNEESGIYE